MQNEHHFDYIIIGNGLAGLQLALAFANDNYFQSKRIALIDAAEKTTNDKTWSFWEQGSGQWDNIVHKSWDKALFYSPGVFLELPLKPYQYKSIRSLDFYNFSKDKLSANENIHFISDTIESTEEKEVVRVNGAKSIYSATHVFDSRIPKEFFTNSQKYAHIHQHFKGLVIETKKPSFDPKSFTMMDYRFNYEGSTSFIYVLPISETRALVEYTFFTPFLVDTSVYDNAIDHYLKVHLRLETFQILETEIGNIPMTDYPFWKFNTSKVTKIGTGGGWVKGSTGYSFKHTEKKVALIIENIKNDKVPSANLFKNKFKFYDQIFLDVLQTNNKKGIWIFEQFYSKNSISTMFRFLDEETTFREDLAIMKSLFSMDFIKSFFKVLFRF